MISEMPSLKNQLQKRKRGNKLVCSFAKQVGEAGFDKDPIIIKIIMSICHDNNFKIRLDGMMFFKDYLSIEIKDKSEIIKCKRFKDMYLPEIIELVNDEEAYIRIEALDLLADYMDQLEHDEIDKEYMPAITKTIEVGIEEISIRLAQMIGKIAYNLKDRGYHLKYKEIFINFFKEMIESKEIEMKRHAAYNLACFYTLYKPLSQDECDLDFQDLYL